MKHVSYIEKQIINKLLDTIFADTRLIGVHVWDGEDWAHSFPTKDRSTVEAVIGDTDQTHIHITYMDGSKRDGSVMLVHGNDVDVISDYHVHLEAFVKPASDLANEIAG